MNAFQQMEYNCKLGVDYPNPVVPPSHGMSPRDDDGGGINNRSGNSRTSRSQPPKGKQPKPYQSGKNRGQRYEMKSVKTGGYQLE